MKERLIGGAIGLVVGLVGGFGVVLYMSKWDFNPPQGWMNHILTGLICGVIGGLFGLAFGMPKGV